MQLAPQDGGSSRLATGGLIRGRRQARLRPPRRSQVVGGAGDEWCPTQALPSRRPRAADTAAVVGRARGGTEATKQRGEIANGDAHLSEVEVAERRFGMLGGIGRGMNWVSSAQPSPAVANSRVLTGRTNAITRPPRP